jgi:hypothetical protein
MSSQVIHRILGRCGAAGDNGVRQMKPTVAMNTITRTLTVTVDIP